MKSFLIALVLYLTAFAAIAAIEWTRKGTPIIEYRNGATTIQLGLRADGVVVWREITSAESVTNSPAEPPPRLTSPAVRDAIQPLWMTNWIYQGDGNILVLTNDIRYGPMPTLR